MTGVVTRYFPAKGYAFIRDENGATRFFHAGAVLPLRDWDRVREGCNVIFEPAQGPDPDKLRAEQVQLC